MLILCLFDIKISTFIHFRLRRNSRIDLLMCRSPCEIVAFHVKYGIDNEAYTHYTHTQTLHSCTLFNSTNPVTNHQNDLIQLLHLSSFLMLIHFLCSHWLSAHDSRPPFSNQLLQSATSPPAVFIATIKKRENCLFGR